MLNPIVGNACPYLGRCDDPDSYYAFAADANCCYTERRPVPIAPSYQATTCLAEGWAACPRYQVAKGRVPPQEAAVAGVPGRPARISRPPWLLIAGLAAAGVAFLVLFLVLRPGLTGGQPSPAASTPIVMHSQTPEGGPLTATPLPDSTSTPENTMPPVTPSPLSSAAPPLAPTSTWTPAPEPSFTPTSTPTPSPTTTPSPTSSPAATPTPSPTSTRTPTPTPTRTPSPTPTSTGAAPPPVRPTATSTPLPAPTLVAPADRQEFTAEAEVVLTWRPAAPLPPGAYYAITVAYSHLGATWHDDVPWTRDTSWALSEHRYLLDLCDDGFYRWSVQIVHQTTGVLLSPPSEVRTLIWRRASGGGGGGTPTPPRP